MAEADGARERVRRLAEAGRAATEHLRARLQVDMHLEPDDGLPAVCAHRSPSGTKSNPSARSRAWPARKSVFSENCGPINWRPTGSPSERPHGIESPGIPAMFDGIVSTSERYIASGFAVFSPSLNATVGDVALQRTW